MNVIVIDAYDWANRIGDQTGNPDGQSDLYEGVIAYELEHLLMNYLDPGEVSWVDEGLADLAIFLNGYDIGGSHLTYHQVFHRETSLTRWGGGLENYGPRSPTSSTCGNRPKTVTGRTTPTCSTTAPVATLIKLIFENELDGMACRRPSTSTTPRSRAPRTTCARPRSSSRTGRSPSSSTTRARTAGTSSTSTSATRTSRAGASTSRTTCSGRTAASTSAGFRKPLGEQPEGSRRRARCRSASRTRPSATSVATSPSPSPVTPPSVSPHSE